jgi:hypothetical protein
MTMKLRTLQPLIIALAGIALSALFVVAGTRGLELNVLKGGGIAGITFLIVVLVVKRDRRLSLGSIALLLVSLNYFDHERVSLLAETWRLHAEEVAPGSYVTRCSLAVLSMIPWVTIA